MSISCSKGDRPSGKKMANNSHSLWKTPESLWKTWGKSWGKQRPAQRIVKKLTSFRDLSTDIAFLATESTVQDKAADFSCPVPLNHLTFLLIY